MKVLGVVPARMASMRFPGKPLKDICGKTLIQRVWEQASQATVFSRLVVATDSEEIRAAATGFGAEVIMTPSNVATGSDRVAAVLDTLGEAYDLIANVQGDMPFINPRVIEKTTLALAESPDFDMSTVAIPIHSEEEFFRPSCVKVVFDEDKKALYFSRAPIPYPRDKPQTGEPFGYKHIGLYVFTPATLKKMSALSQTICEKREGLEQLRALGNGTKIKIAIVAISEMTPAIEVDAPEDFERACEWVSTLR